MTGLGVSNGPETTRNSKALSEGPLEVLHPMLGPNRVQTLLWEGGGARCPDQLFTPWGMGARRGGRGAGGSAASCVGTLAQHSDRLDGVRGSAGTPEPTAISNGVQNAQRHHSESP